MRENILKILKEIKVDLQDNSDNVMMGDTRGNTLWRIGNAEQITDKLLNLLSEDSQKLIIRLEAAEAFIDGEGTYSWTWERKFKAWSDWDKLRPKRLR